MYSTLGTPAFERDFENVDYHANDFDLALGARGLHEVRKKVEWIERPTVLPPELFGGFANDMFWRTAEAADRNVRNYSVRGMSNG